jgi:hypothetical protein
MQSLPHDQKKFYIETLEVVVTGSAKGVFQGIVDADPDVDFGFDKPQSLGIAKRYNENLCKLQGLPLSIVD